MGHKSFSLALAILAALPLFASGCAPRLGEGCSVSTDCSVNGDRICDLAQPGGYCTIPDCSPGACGDEGYCVRFRPDNPRLSRDYCMAKCSETSDCDRDRYVCRSPDQLNRPPEDKDGDDGTDSAGDAGTDGGADSSSESKERVAEILDGKQSSKFCVVRK